MAFLFQGALSNQHCLTWPLGSLWSPSLRSTSSPSLGALQGLDESVPEEDISCGDTPLKAIVTEETVIKNGLSLSRPAIRGLNVAKYYQPHDAPCRLDVVPPVESEVQSRQGR